MCVGFRIFTKINRPEKELIEAFKGLPAANVADVMSRFFCVNSAIKSFNNKPLLGTAFTVRARIGDNLLLHKAIAMAQPGDVIIVDGDGDISNAFCGDIMMTECQSLGIAGVIIDGAVRDKADLEKLDMPVYARGVMPKGPFKDGPGEINVPISCGGVVVNPGDIVIGDADGVVIVPPKQAKEIAAKAWKKHETEAASLEQIANGRRDKFWVDKALEAKGCEIIDDYYRA